MRFILATCPLQVAFIGQDLDAFNRITAARNYRDGRDNLRITSFAATRRSNVRNASAFDTVRWI